MRKGFHSEADFWMSVVQYANIIIAIPTVFLNIYFAIRFGKLKSISANLRVIMIFTNFSSTICVLLLSVLTFVPENVYATNDGHFYVSTFVYYCLQFLCRVFILILDLKFVIITVERRIAFIRRSTYETATGWAAVRLMMVVLIVITIVTGCRSLYVFKANVETVGTSRALRRSLITAESPLDLAIYFFLGGVSFVVGGIDILLLNRTLDSYKFGGATLSERFQLREILQILHIIQHLFLAFCLVAAACGVCFAVMLWDYFFRSGRNCRSTTFLMALHIDYLLVAVYLLYSTLYMVWTLGGVRKAIFDDIQRLFGVAKFSTSVGGAVAPMSTIHVAEAHFEFLSQQWNQ